MVQHSCAGLLAALFSLSEGAAEIQIQLRFFSRSHIGDSRLTIKPDIALQDFTV